MRCYSWSVLNILSVISSLSYLILYLLIEGTLQILTIFMKKLTFILPINRLKVCLCFSRHMSRPIMRQCSCMEMTPTMALLCLLSGWQLLTVESKPDSVTNLEASCLVPARTGWFRPRRQSVLGYHVVAPTTLDVSPSRRSHALPPRQRPRAGASPSHRSHALVPRRRPPAGATPSRRGGVLAPEPRPPADAHRV